MFNKPADRSAADSEASLRVLHGLGKLDFGAAEALLNQILPTALPRLAAWARRTVHALPASEARAAGYRDLLPSDSEKDFEWYFPRSNAAERIEAFLYLSHCLNDSS